MVNQRTIAVYTAFKYIQRMRETFGAVSADAFLDSYVSKVEKHFPAVKEAVMSEMEGVAR